MRIHHNSANAKTWYEPSLPRLALHPYDPLPVKFDLPLVADSNAWDSSAPRGMPQVPHHDPLLAAASMAYQVGLLLAPCTCDRMLRLIGFGGLF